MTTTVPTVSSAADKMDGYKNQFFQFLMFYTIWNHWSYFVINKNVCVFVTTATAAYVRLYIIQTRARAHTALPLCARRKSSWPGWACSMCWVVKVLCVAPHCFSRSLRTAPALASADTGTGVKVGRASEMGFMSRWPLAGPLTPGALGVNSGMAAERGARNWLASALRFPGAAAPTQQHPQV